MSMCGEGGYNSPSGWQSADYCPSTGFNQSGSTPDTYYLYTMLYDSLANNDSRYSRKNRKVKTLINATKIKIREKRGKRGRKKVSISKKVVWLEKY